MPNAIRWLGWGVAILALILAWRVDQEPLPVAAGQGASRVQILPLGEYRSAEAVSFGQLLPANNAGPSPRLHVAAQDQRAVTLALALDHSANRQLGEAFPALRTPAESAQRLSLEATLLERRDWDVDNLELTTLVDQLSQALDVPIELDAPLRPGEDPARLALAGSFRYQTALEIAREAARARFCLVRDGRLVLTTIDLKHSSERELWVLPQGVSGDCVAMLSNETAEATDLRGVSVLREWPVVGCGRQLARMVAAPFEPTWQVAAVADPPPSDAWRERTVEVPQGAVTLGALARLLSRQTGKAILVLKESQREAEQGGPFTGPLSQLLDRWRGHLYLREDGDPLELLELRRLRAGRGLGEPLLWRYYPLPELGDPWGRTEPPLWELARGRRAPTLPIALPLEPVRELLRYTSNAQLELMSYDPDGLFFCRVRREHEALAQAFGPQSNLARVLYQVHHGPRHARAEALRAALAGDDPLAQVFALRSLDDTTVPADQRLLLNLLRAKRPPLVNARELGELAWLACRRWCSVAELTSAVEEILRTEPLGEAGTPHIVAYQAAGAEVPEFDAVVAHWLSRQLAIDSPSQEVLTFAQVLARRPACRDTLKDVVLAAAEKKAIFMDAADLAHLVLEALRDARPDQRRLACRVVAKMHLPQEPEQLRTALARLRYDPLVQDLVPRALDRLDEAELPELDFVPLRPAR